MKKEMPRSGLFLGFIVFLLVATVAPVGAADSVFAPSIGQTIYLPVYSHVFSGDRENPVYLTAIMILRNTDPTRPLTVTAVDYYASDGGLIKRHLTAPQIVKALGTLHFTVKESDKTGGVGAKFIIEWQSDQPVAPPIAEGLMIGTQMQHGISLNTRGQVVRERTP